MRFMLLLMGPDEWAEDPDYDFAADMARHQAFAEWCAESRIDIVDGTALQPSSHARTIDNRGENQLVTDGGALDTREQVGGMYVIETDSWERAMEAALRVPDGDPVEVRRVLHSLGENPRDLIGGA